MTPTLPIDRYTKAVLTVIAGCLLFQCVMAAGRVVQAQQPGSTGQGARPGQPGVVDLQPQPVVIVGWDAAAIEGQPPLPVRIERSEPLTVTVSTVLTPIRLTYSAENPVPVAINGIKKASGPWDAINTRVDPQAMSAVPGRVKP